VIEVQTDLTLSTVETSALLSCFLVSVSSCPTTDICRNVCGNVIFNLPNTSLSFPCVFLCVLVILYSFCSETELFSFLRVQSVNFLASVIPYYYCYYFLLFIVAL